MTPTIPAPRTLVPLIDIPDRDPAPWLDAAARGVGAVAVVGSPTARPVSALEVADARFDDGLRRLASAGTRALGRISLGFATRPLTEILGEIDRWAALPIDGIYFDHTPSGPYQVGPVVHAVRAARRLGLDVIVLNAGVAVDPIYRRLDTTICTFEGTWTEYRMRNAGEFRAGDGHLVVDVPPDDLPLARAMVLARQASLHLVTDRPAPFATAVLGQPAARPVTRRRPPSPRLDGDADSPIRNAGRHAAHVPGPTQPGAVDAAASLR